jgi:hypothetical protein
VVAGVRYICDGMAIRWWWTIHKTCQWLAHVSGFLLLFRFQFLKHIDNITKKTNATSAFLRRNINSCSRQVKAQC